MSETLPPVVVEVHEKYISHVMSCVGCHAPNRRHCGVGLDLRVEYDAQYLMTIRELFLRRRSLAHEMDAHPASARKLRDRVVELYTIEQQETP